jgi:hypothetical protein
MKCAPDAMGWATLNDHRSPPVRTFSNTTVRAGSVIHLLLAGTAIGTLGLSGVMITTSLAPTTSHVPQPGTRHEIALALYSAGLSAETLAAAGVTEPNVAALVASAGRAAHENIDAIRAAERAWSSAKGELDSRERRLRAGPAVAKERAEYLAARERLAAAEKARATLYGAMVTGAAEHMTPEQMQAVRNIHDCRTRGVALEFRAQERTSADWIALREALASARISPRLGRADDPRGQEILLKARAEPRVAAMVVNLEALERVEADWRQAAGY